MMPPLMLIEKITLFAILLTKPYKILVSGLSFWLAIGWECGAFNGAGVGGGPWSSIINDSDAYLGYLGADWDTVWMVKLVSLMNFPWGVYKINF